MSSYYKSFFGLWEKQILKDFHPVANNIFFDLDKLFLRIYFSSYRSKYRKAYTIQEILILEKQRRNIFPSLFIFHLEIVFIPTQ